MGAELTKLTCEMFPFIEEILPKRGRWGGEALSAQIKGGPRSADQCFQESNSIITGAERLLPTGGSVGHADLVTDDLSNPRGICGGGLSQSALFNAYRQL